MEGSCLSSLLGGSEDWEALGTAGTLLCLDTNPGERLLAASQNYQWRWCLSKGHFGCKEQKVKPVEARKGAGMGKESQFLTVLALQLCLSFDSLSFLISFQ